MRELFVYRLHENQDEMRHLEKSKQFYFVDLRLAFVLLYPPGVRVTVDSIK